MFKSLIIILDFLRYILTIGKTAWESDSSSYPQGKRGCIFILDLYTVLIIFLGIHILGIKVIKPIPFDVICSTVLWNGNSNRMVSFFHSKDLPIIQIFCPVCHIYSEGSALIIQDLQFCFIPDVAKQKPIEVYCL